MRWLLLIYLMAGEVSAVEAADSVARLNNGKELEGHLVNQEIAVHTAYGSISVRGDVIAEVHFNPGAENDSILTTIGNRFSGYINDKVQFKPAAGEQVLLNQFELEFVRVRGFLLTNASRFLVLINGDVLSGDYTLPALAVTNASGALTIQPETVDSVWFKKSEQAVEVQLVDGKQMRAAFAKPSLLIQLDSGGELDIPRELLKVLYWRAGSIPPEVVRLRASRKGTNFSSTLAAPDRMVWIPPGNVMLGSPLDERGRNSDEDPRTLVTISRGFWMGKYEVTQAEYLAVMGVNPSTFRGDTNRPVEKVSWHDANDYCARLTEAEGDRGTLPAGYVYRLPTEAEWEYACRANTTTRFSFGEDPDERELRDYAWFTGNSDWTTHPVGQLKPNAWGLYDMHGNVLEWCASLWSQSYPGGQVIDYNGPTEGWLRVARGGSWLYGGAFARSANRDDYGAGNECSDLGFRVVLAPPL